MHPEHRIKPLWLSDEEYSRAMSALPIVCTDAVIIERGTGLFYLARRRVQPCPDWWIIGGRVSAGEPFLDAMRRNFLRETGVDVSTERFSMMSIYRFLWATREQAPQTAGSDNLAFTYAVELTPAEREWAAQHLDPTEYDHKIGLRPFTCANLQSAQVHPSLIDLYDACFPAASSSKS